MVSVHYLTIYLASVCLIKVVMHGSEFLLYRLVQLYSPVKKIVYHFFIVKAACHHLVNRFVHLWCAVIIPPPTSCSHRVLKIHEVDHKLLFLYCWVSAINVKHL